MSSQTYGRNAYESQLDGALNNSATSFDVDSATGLTAPLYLVIDPESPTLREVIKVGSIATNTFNSVSRGLAGSAAGAQAHDSGIIVRATFTHQMLDDIFTDINALETADSGHFGGTDTADHPEATTSIRGFMSGADKTKLDAVPAGATNDHDSLINVSIDDHHARDHAASHADGGADELDPANQASGAAASGTVLTADGVGGIDWLGIPGGITDHGALTGLADDDHSQYHTDARFDTRFGTKVINDLSGVVISSVGTNELLQWNGSNWINRTLSEAGIPASGHTHTGSTISSLAAADTTSGSFADARIPNLNASKTTAGTFAIGRIPTGTTSSTAALGNHGHSNLVATAGDSMTGKLTITEGSDVGLKVYRTTGSAGLGVVTVSTNVGGTDTQKYFVESDGDNHNTNNSYTGLSDRRLKVEKSIKTARSYLDDLCKLRIVNYSLKQAPDTKLLGLVADEAEQIFPALVKKGVWEGKYDVVKYSVLIPMLVTAVQELTDRVGILESV